jgi:hypothetical protein
MLVCDVWSVAFEKFGDFAAVEEYQDPEQFPVLVEGKSLLHFRLIPITTCILITLLFIIAMH